MHQTTTPRATTSRRTLWLPTRHLAGLLACLTVLAVAAPGGTAAAAPATSNERIDVTANRFPTVTQVARIFPAYRGGGRELYPSRQLSTTTDDCLGYGLAFVQPRDGKVAHYVARDGQSPFFTGSTSVVVAVYEFSKPKRAQAALDEQRDAIESCYGRHAEGGFTSAYSPLTAPELAQDEFAFRLVSGDPNVGRDWFVSVYAREGRFMLEARLQRDRDAPSARAAFQLARVSVRIVR